jgi:hypothetical protein
MVALVFGTISIPLAFLGHLVSLSVVCALLALFAGAMGRWVLARSEHGHTQASVSQGVWGMRLGGLGLLLAVIFWVMWSTKILPG